ncbi:MAG: glycoside hydrolase family 3 N-terminal domain-containing protein [Rhodocyclaceae bacterium]
MKLFEHTPRMREICIALAGAALLSACGGDGSGDVAPINDGNTGTGYVDPAKLDAKPLYATEDMPAVSAQIVADATAHVTGKSLIKVDNLSFKDLNGNGILDPYEDYRKSVNERTEDLLSRMTIDQKVGLMTVDNGYMRAGDSAAALCPTSTPMLGNRDLVCETGFALYGGLAVGVPTSTLINEYNTRYVVTRDASPAPATLARWSNQMQEIAEASSLGIPMVIVSNPRDHAASGFGFSESSGHWPGTLGMAAAALGDKSAHGSQTLIHDFATLAMNEWVSTGVRKGYMYQADLATEPRWSRVNGTFGDDPDLISEIQTQLIEGFQSPANVSSSKLVARMGVAMTTKHFPGNGIAPNGLDSHGHEGMYAVYASPKSLSYHLKPFQAAVDAGTSAIMTYYQAPKNAGSVEQLPKDFWYSPSQQFEEVGAGFNDMLLAYLRKGMGFNGIINTDSRIVLDEGEPHGVENLTSIQRDAKAINAGVNLISVGTGEYRNGVFEAVAHKDIRAALDQGLVKIDQINDSTRRLLKEIFRLGLFEARYVNEAYATTLANESKSKALEAQHKSVVLLKNNDVLPLKSADAGVRIYAEGFAKGTAKASLTSSLKAKLKEAYPNATFVDDYTQASVAFLMITPANTTLCTQEGAVGYVECAAPPSALASGLTRSHQEIGINDFTIGAGGLTQIQAIQAKTKSVVMVNLGNPFLLNDVEPNASAVVATYDITVDALLDVIKGAFNPTGRLPMSIPAGQSALTSNAADLPGHYENFAYAYKDAKGSEYKFGFGLSYNK